MSQFVRAKKGILSNSKPKLQNESSLISIANCNGQHTVRAHPLLFFDKHFHLCLEPGKIHSRYSNDSFWTVETSRTQKKWQIMAIAIPVQAYNKCPKSFCCFLFVRRRCGETNVALYLYWPREKKNIRNNWGLSCNWFLCSGSVDISNLLNCDGYLVNKIVRWVVCPIVAHCVEGLFLLYQLHQIHLCFVYKSAHFSRKKWFEYRLCILRCHQIWFENVI